MGKALLEIQKFAIISALWQLCSADADSIMFNKALGKRCLALNSLLNIAYYITLLNVQCTLVLWPVISCLILCKQHLSSYPIVEMF